MKHQIALGLGSNIGNSKAELARAVAALGAELVITAVSSIYRTPPWGKTDQPDFYNLCLTAKTDKTPQQLLQFVKKLEQELGRQPNIRWGERLIDIDILLYGDTVYHDETLDIPHIHLQDRAFVLVPLAEIAPAWVHPLLGQTMAGLKTAVSKDGIKKVSDSKQQDPLGFVVQPTS